jgi:hypothetical protein
LMVNPNDFKTSKNTKNKPLAREKVVTASSFSS